MCTSKNEASTSPEFSGASAGYGVLVISGVFGCGEVLSENCKENETIYEVQSTFVETGKGLNLKYKYLLKTFFSNFEP